uniref:Uncharacterized protein n=1 Tax=Anguilla anguilla TaxID=7936 RepID=A0A0E9UW97_ANGAN
MTSLLLISLSLSLYPI